MENKTRSRMEKFLAKENIKYTKMSIKIDGTFNSYDSLYFFLILSNMTYAVYIHFKEDGENYRIGTSIEIEDFVNNETESCEFETFKEMESVIQKFVLEEEIKNLFKIKKLHFLEMLIERVKEHRITKKSIELTKEQILRQVQICLNLNDKMDLEQKIGTFSDKEFRDFADSFV